MVNQPPPHDPNYGQQPPQAPGYGQPQAPGPYGPPQPGGQQQPQAPAPDYGQPQPGGQQQPQAPAPDYGQPQSPAPYGQPQPGGQLPPPAYPMPQAGFTPPPNLTGPRRPGGVAGLMVLLLALAGFQLGAVILGIIDYIDFTQYRYPDDGFSSMTWYVGTGIDVLTILGLILAGVMVAGGKDGARIFAAFLAGVVFEGAFRTVINMAFNFFDHGHATFLGVLAFVFHLLLSVGAIIAVVMAVGKPVSRWFAGKVLGRTA